MIRLKPALAFVLAVGLMVVSGLALAALALHGRGSEATIAADLVGDLSARVVGSDVHDQARLYRAVCAWAESQPHPLHVHVRGPRGTFLVASPAAQRLEGPLRTVSETKLTLVHAEGREDIALSLVAPRPASMPFPLRDQELAAVASVLLCWLVMQHLIRRRRSRGPFGAQWSHARERVTQTLDVLTASVLVCDARGRIAFVNRASEEAMSLPAERLVGMDIESLGWTGCDLPQGNIDARPPSWREAVAAPGATHRTTVALAAASGAPRVFHASSVAVRSRRKVLGALVVLDEVTALVEQGRELDAARREAQHANEARGTFLANMSHEIRTPINGVLGTLELLSVTQLAPRQRQYAEAASKSASALLHLINDILDFSKIDAGKLELAPIEFDLEACVVDALRIVAPAAASKGLELLLSYRAEPGLRVVGDPDRLRQVLLNLINNAIKFTERGEVELIVSATPQDESDMRVEVEVRDTGPGIPPDRLGRLFKAFSQADSTTSRQYGGTGLGLVISRQLVELMSGRILVRSTVGEGSTFFFDVVLGQATSARLPIAADELPRRVIVWDSSTSARDSMATSLRAAFEEVRAASCLAEMEAAAAADKGHGTLIVVGARSWSDDLLPPLRSLKQAAPHADCLLALAEDPEPVAESAIRTIAEGWVRKPVTPTALVTALTRSGDVNATPCLRVLRPDLVRGIRVLVAEDNTVGQMVTTEHLRSLGLECDIAATGRQAVEMARTGRYAVVLMDCHLPELDGFDATRQIRSLEHGNDVTPVKIIALTASAMAGDRERCIGAGMDGYVTKPVTRDMLATTLSDALGIPLVIAEDAPPAMREDERQLEHVGHPASPSETPVFDERELLSRCMGNHDVAGKLLELFRESTRQDLHRLEQAVESGVRELVGEVAHAIAGSSLQVGAVRLGTLARQVEQTVQSEGLSLQEVLERLRAEYESCDAYIRDARSREAGSAARL